MKRPLICLCIAGLTAVALAQQVPTFAQNQQRAAQLNAEGVKLTDQSRDIEALQRLDEATALDPNNDNIALNRADVLQKLGRYSEALTQCDDCLRRDPLSQRAHYSRSSALYGLGLLGQARFETLRASGLEEGGPRISNHSAELLDLGLPQVDLQLQLHEIRVEGLAFKRNTSGNQNRLELEAIAFGLPSGRFRPLPEPKRKLVEVFNIEPEYWNLGAIPLSQVKAGDYVIVIGQERGDTLVARRVVISRRTPQEEKRRGSVFNAARLPLVEDQNYPELDKDTAGSATFKSQKGQTLSAVAAAVIRDGNRAALVTTMSSIGWQGWNRVKRPKNFLQTLMTTQAVLGLRSEEVLKSIQTARPLRVKLSTNFPGGTVVAVGVQNGVKSLPLAPRNPQRGEVVYLAGWYDDSIWWHESVVAYVDSQRLFLHIGKEGEEAWIPGSIVVNKKGEVVGLEVAHEEPYINAVSVEALRRSIQSTGPSPSVSAPKK